MLGAIVNKRPPGVDRCLDGKYTTSQAPGRCSSHGGVSFGPSARVRRAPVAAPKVIIVPQPRPKPAPKRNAAPVQRARPKPAPAPLPSPVLPVAPRIKAQPRATSMPTGIVMVPIQSVAVNRAWFQNRATPYSERSVSAITEAVENGQFRWINFDPVSLWAAPDGKLYVLSGHSRHEAFMRLCRAGKTAEGRNFCEIPAKIATNLSLEQAKRIAQESNTLSTKETELERAAFYRRARAEGKNIDAEAKRLEGDNASTVLAISYLAPAGKTMNALQALSFGDTTSQNNIRTIARWIGNARKRVPELTNSHEDELYDWLVTDKAYGTRAGQVSNEREFGQRLNALINRRTTFGRIDERLNLRNNVTMSPVEAQYNAQLREAKQAIQDLERQLDEKIRDLRARGGTETQILDITAPISASLTRARLSYQNLAQKRSDVSQYARAESNLFSEVAGYAIRPEMIVTGVAGRRRVKNTEMYRNIYLKASPGVKVDYQITSSESVAKFIKTVIGPRIGVQEAFGMILMKQDNGVIGYSIISMGGIAATVVDVRIVLATALKSLATSIILFHNHPSGSLTPSHADNLITEKLVSAGKLVDVKVLDHLIVTPKGDYYSFADKGMI